MRIFRKDLLIFVTFGALLLIFEASYASAQNNSEEGEVQSTLLSGTDYHEHIRTQDFYDALALLKEKWPEAVGDLPKPQTRDVSVIIKSLDQAKIQKALVLSAGYFFGVPELDGTPFDNLTQVRRENEATAKAVALFPDRLIGYFSVNPLKDYALDEIRFWGQEGSLVGLKLHLANSDLDLQNKNHVTRLAEVFQLAREMDFPIVIHLRTRNPEYGSEDVNSFIRDVLLPAKGVKVQIAHFAGWGRYDEPTDAAVMTFIEAFSEYGPTLKDRVWFDLAAVIVPGVDQTAWVDTIVNRIHQVGIDRVVFGTDGEDRGSAQEQWQLFQKVLPLSEEEWLTIRSQMTPLIEK